MVVPDIPTFADLAATVRSAVARADRDAATTAVHEHGRRIASEAGDELRALIGELPPDWWESDPLAVALIGSCSRSADTAGANAALGYFDAAQRIMAADPATPAATRVSVDLDHAAALRTVSRVREARALVDETRALLDDAHIPSVRTRMRLVARAALEDGMLNMATGDFLAAERALTLALGLAPHAEPAEIIECLGALALVDYSAGRFDDALDRVARVRELAHGTVLLERAYAAPALCAESMVRAERGDFEHVRALLPTLHRACGSTGWAPVGLVVEAHLLAAAAFPAAALEALYRAEQVYLGHEEPAFGRDTVRLVRAAILVALDRGDEARLLLEAVPEYGRHLLCPQRFLAQLALLHGDLSGADAALRPCERLGAEHAGRPLIDVRLIRAAVDLQRGDLTSSDLAFDGALLGLARTATLMPLRHVPRDISEALLARAAQRAQPEPVRTILDGGIRAVGLDRRIEPLSERELLVLAHVERGLTVGAIAQQLYISPNTVKTHLRRLYRKLGVTNRQEASRHARALGVGGAVPSAVTRDSPGAGAAGPAARMF